MLSKRSLLAAAFNESDRLRLRAVGARDGGGTPQPPQHACADGDLLVRLNLKLIVMSAIRGKVYVWLEEGLTTKKNTKQRSVYVGSWWRWSKEGSTVGRLLISLATELLLARWRRRNRHLVRGVFLHLFSSCRLTTP